jgi:hypothetical protein
MGALLYGSREGSRRTTAPPHRQQIVTHTLCLDNCQTFEFCPGGHGVTVIRRAPRPVMTRKGLQPRGAVVTGNFQMTRDEARKFWADLVKDGAFRA